MLYACSHWLPCTPATGSNSGHSTFWYVDTCIPNPPIENRIPIQKSYKSLRVPLMMMLSICSLSFAPCAMSHPYLHVHTHCSPLPTHCALGGSHAAAHGSTSTWFCAASNTSR